MTTVAEILRAKGNSTIYSVSPSDTMLAALQLMADKSIGALLVLEGGEIAGIVTERDYARKIALQGRSSKDTLVKEIMTRDVLYVTPNTTTHDCMALMSEKKIRHLPVLDGTTVVGMISVRDLLDDIIADHEETIAQLENYIRS